MATNKVQMGNTITYAHSVAVVSGEAVSIGDRIGVALGGYESDEAGVYDLEGVFTLPKATAADALAAGTEVFLTSAGNISTSNSGNTAAGFVFAASASGAATVDVKINA